MNIYDLISRAQKLRKETQLDSVSPDRVGGLHEDTLKYINEFQLLASSPSLHKAYASVSAMQSDKSPKSDLTGKPLKPGQLVVIVPANQTDATAGDVYRYDGPSGNTSAWTFVAKIGAVPADAELSATSTNPPQNKVVTEKLTELESEVRIPLLSSDFVQGSINTDGTENITPYRIRSNKIAVSKGAIIRVTTSGQYVTFHSFDDGGSSLGNALYGSWNNLDRNVEITHDGYIVAIVCNSIGESIDIVPSGLIAKIYVKSVMDELTEQVDVLYNSLMSPLLSSDFVQGSINTDGTENITPYRIRSNKIAVSKGAIIRVTTSGQYVTFHSFDDGGSSLGNALYGSWNNLDRNVEITHDGYIVAIVCNSIGESIDIVPSGLIAKIYVKKINEAYMPKGVDNALSAMKRFAKPNDGKNNYSQYAAIVHITDTHGDKERVKMAYKVAEQIGATIVCSGDIVYYNSQDDVKWFNELSENSNTPMVLSLGNHDTWQYSYESEVYAKFIAPHAKKKNWILPNVENPTYFYYDDDRSKIRYICVNQWQCPNVEISLHYYTLYSQEQVNWICSTLMSVPKDYGIFIVVHSPENKLTPSEGYDKFFVKNGGDVSNIETQHLNDIIDAYIGKSVINKNYNTAHNAFFVNADFSSAQGEFIAFISGHVHQDLICYNPATKEKQLILNETCTCAWINKNINSTQGDETTDNPYLNEGSDLARQIGTDNEHAFNVYVIDKENKEIRVVRIGSNLTYQLEKRDYMRIAW